MQPIPIGFFGVVVESGKMYTQTVEDPFRLTMAALQVPAEADGKKHAKRSTLKVQTTDGENKPEFVLCNLTEGACEQQKLDFAFNEGETITFSIDGDLSVHLTGHYFMYDVAEEEMDSSCDEDAYGYPISDESVSESASGDEAVAGDSSDEEIPSDEAGSSSDEDASVIEGSSGSDEEELTEEEIRRQFKEFAKQHLQGIEIASDSESASDDEGTPKIEEMSASDEDDVSIDEEELAAAIAAASDESDESAEESDESEIAELIEEPAEEIAEMLVQEAKNAKKNNKRKQVDAAPAEQPAAKQAKQPAAKQPAAKQVPEKTEAKESAKRTLPSGLVIEDHSMGNGARAKPGKRVTVRYIGKLANGKVFDENTKGAPFKFKLGAGDVIKGWDMGVKGMQVGGTRMLTIPPGLAYGSRGAPPEIPPNATLRFEVKLLGVN